MQEDLEDPQKDFGYLGGFGETPRRDLEGPPGGFRGSRRVLEEVASAELGDEVLLTHGDRAGDSQDRARSLQGLGWLRGAVPEPRGCRAVGSGGTAGTGPAAPAASQPCPAGPAGTSPELGSASRSSFPPGIISPLFSTGEFFLPLFHRLIFLPVFHEGFFPPFFPREIFSSLFSTANFFLPLFLG